MDGRGIFRNVNQADAWRRRIEKPGAHASRRQGPPASLARIAKCAEETAAHRGGFFMPRRSARRPRAAAYRGRDRAMRHLSPASVKSPRQGPKAALWLVGRHVSSLRSSGNRRLAVKLAAPAPVRVSGETKKRGQRRLCFGCRGADADAARNQRGLRPSVGAAEKEPGDAFG